MPDPFICRNAGDDAPHRKRQEHKDGLCFTCWQAQRKRRRRQSRVSSVRRTFGWSESELAALRDAQRGTYAPDDRVRCPCGRAVDRGKEPAMDHSHRMEAAGVPIRYTVRALLCSPCNRFLGQIGDRPEALINLAKVLIELPAQAVLSGLDDT